MKNLNNNGFTASQHRYFRRKIKRTIDKGKIKGQEWLDTHLVKIKAEMSDMAAKNREV